MNRTKDLTILLLFVAVVYLAATHDWSKGIDRDRGSTHVISIAVMPFVPTGPGDGDYGSVVTDFNDALVSELAEISNLRVTDARVSSVVERESSDNHPAVSRFGVDVILEGAVHLTDSRLRVWIQLLDGRTHLWAETYDRELDDLPSIAQEIARSIARVAKVSSKGV